MEDNNPYYDEYEIDLREYILLLWDNKLFIGGLIIMAVLAAFLYSKMMIPKIYETQTRIQLSNYEGLYSEENTAIQILSSTGLIKDVMTDLGIEMTASELNGHINNNLSVNQIGDTSIISITVQYNEPQQTLKIAEGIINSYKNKSDNYFKVKIENDKEYIADLNNNLETVNNNLEKNEKLIDQTRNSGKLEAVSLLIQEHTSLLNSKRGLRREIKERKSELLNFYSLEVLDQPYLPENPVSPNTKLNIAIAAVLGLMLAVFIVFFREFMKEE